MNFGIIIASGSSKSMLTVVGSKISSSVTSTTSSAGSDTGLEVSFGCGGMGLMLSFFTTGIMETEFPDELVVVVIVPDVICGKEVTTLSFSLGTLIVNLGTIDGEQMAELGADDDDEIGEDSNELILFSLEQLSSEASGFGGIGLIVSLGIGTSDGSLGMVGGGLGMGLMVSFGIVDVMFEC